jgi:hypothetical protein
MPASTQHKRGGVGRRLTLQQRQALLERIRAEVAAIVEDVEAAAETIRIITTTHRAPTQLEQAALQLVGAEQRRQQLELTRLYQEYESVAFRVAPTGAAPAQAA